MLLCTMPDCQTSAGCKCADRAWRNPAPHGAAPLAPSNVKTYTITAGLPTIPDEMVEAAAAAFAAATGYYVPFHRGLSSESADKLRDGIRAALAAVAYR